MTPVVGPYLGVPRQRNNEEAS
ncbi:hypothetical protein SMALA_1478 [Streptomyces malaysiensis subsp. malaysiensis]|nr:hypothetical protein SMALA_1478 [Streptomyces malaysiensis]